MEIELLEGKFKLGQERSAAAGKKKNVQGLLPPKPRRRFAARFHVGIYRSRSGKYANSGSLC